MKIIKNLFLFFISLSYLSLFYFMIDIVVDFKLEFLRYLTDIIYIDYGLLFVPLFELAFVLLSFDNYPLIFQLLFFFSPIIAIIGCLRLKKSSWMYKLFTLLPIIMVVIGDVIFLFLNASFLGPRYINMAVLAMAILAYIINKFTEDYI